MKLLFTSNDLQPSLTIFIISSMIFGKHMVEVGFVYWQHKPHDKLCCEWWTLRPWLFKRPLILLSLDPFEHHYCCNTQTQSALSLYFHEWKNSCLVFVAIWVLQQTLSTMYKWFHAIQELVQTLSSTSLKMWSVSTLKFHRLWQLSDSFAIRTSLGAF